MACIVLCAGADVSSISSDFWPSHPAATWRGGGQSHSPCGAVGQSFQSGKYHLFLDHSRCRQTCLSTLSIEAAPDSSPAVAIKFQRSTVRGSKTKMRCHPCADQPALLQELQQHVQKRLGSGKSKPRKMETVEAAAPAVELRVRVLDAAFVMLHHPLEVRCAARISTALATPQSETSSCRLQTCYAFLWQFSVEVAFSICHLTLCGLLMLFSAVQQLHLLSQ